MCVCMCVGPPAYTGLYYLPARCIRSRGRACTIPNKGLTRLMILPIERWVDSFEAPVWSNAHDFLALSWLR